MQTRKVKVVRGFRAPSGFVKVGQVVELPSLFAAEMIAAHKAEALAEEPTPTPKEEAPKPVPKVEAKKEVKRDAR